MTTTQSSETTNTVTPPNKIIDVTASSSQKANLKRVRVSQSSSESDSPRTLSPINTPRFTPQQIIEEQTKVINDHQIQLNKCIEEISRLSKRLV